jgi:hypothetical protein
MKINLLKVATDKLTHLSNDEKVFFLYMGHLRNELTMLQSILNLSSSYDPKNDYLSVINGSMSQLTVRLLAGKLSEGWQYLQSSYFPTKIALNIEPNLQPDSIAALNKLKKYFKGKNLIHKIRNNFAFHYSTKNNSKVINKLDNAEDWQVVFRDQQIPFFISAEQIISETMYEEVNSDPDKALEEFFKEVFDVTQDFKLFCDGCLANMVDNTVPHPLYTTEIDSTSGENQLIAPIVFSSSKYLF